MDSTTNKKNVPAASEGAKPRDTTKPWYRKSSTYEECLKAWNEGTNNTESASATAAPMEVEEQESSSDEDVTPPPSPPPSPPDSPNCTSGIGMVDRLPRSPPPTPPPSPPPSPK